MYENSVQMEIFRPKRAKVTRVWRNLHIKDFMICMYMADMRKKRTTLRVFVRKSEGRSTDET
jgi:hypothetical protein